MLTGATIHVDMKEADAWFLASKPGDRIIYARGNVAADRQKPDTTLHEVARQVLRWERAGFAYLFQRRTEYGFYYIAERRAPPDKTLEHDSRARDRASLACRLGLMA